MPSLTASFEGGIGPARISTLRLELRPADDSSLHASVLGAESFAKCIGCKVAADWPPKHWEPQAVRWLMGRLEESPDEVLWRPWWIGLKDGTLIGTLGTKGPPDTQGIVEIGYSIVASQWRRGLATEAVGAVVSWLLLDPRVKQVCAHTLHEDPASSGVLLKCGFVFAGTLEDPSDGLIDRFEHRKV